ncbi:nucleotidyltransferase domain-containing protein [Bradyrhizobium aeschynomenes]|uniref:nucleotidyltransferase domain-containing protein n=1 Tax=Bradyrhizobium aeschynomenes TaxID=2734909 RepID=UPI001FEED3E2|nr:nucleotidyltransferase domain-containing protein [Bradyrhizobium aeschynomenes]
MVAAQSRRHGGKESFGDLQLLVFALLWLSSHRRAEAEAPRRFPHNIELPTGPEARMQGPMLTRIVDELADVPGLGAIALGGSRARGTASAGSDYDIGLYIARGAALDVTALRTAVRRLVGQSRPVELTEVGGWGRWIVGGGRLQIDGVKVDLLYRPIDAVDRVIDDCRNGQIDIDYQPGHPHGFVSAIWMGEVALCRVLHDPTRQLAELKARCTPYPPRLATAIIARFQWEIGFSIDNAALAVARGDRTHIAGCAYRALACAAQVLFARNARYLINEKAALAEAATLPLTVNDLMARVELIWQAIGSGALSAAIDGLRALETDLTRLTPRDAPD